MEFHRVSWREEGKKKKKKKIFARPCEFFPLKIKTATTNERDVWKGRGGIKEKKRKKDRVEEKKKKKIFEAVAMGGARRNEVQAVFGAFENRRDRPGDLNLQAATGGKIFKNAV